MERYNLIGIGGGGGGLTVAAIAASVHMHAGELLAELTIAQKNGLPLTKLASAIHVYPTLSEVHRALGDAYLLQRTTPSVRRLLSPIFAWLRHATR
jgi:hypothetical protein